MAKELKVNYETKEVSQVAKEKAFRLIQVAAAAIEQRNLYVEGLGAGLGLTGDGWTFNFDRLEFVRTKEEKSDTVKQPLTEVSPTSKI